LFISSLAAAGSKHPMVEKLKIFSSYLLFLSIIFAFANNLFAKNEPKVNIYFFTVKGCPHCDREKQFLLKLEQKYKDINIIILDVTEDKANRELFNKVGKLLKVDIPGVPFTVIGHQYFIGWHSETTSGASLEQAIQEVRRGRMSDPVAGLLPPPAPSPKALPEKALPEKLTLPIFGELELKYFSLGMLTVIIGALDGFNPCAMWVLLFLIGLLLGLEDKKKMWLLGTIFIVASGVVYFLFMSAWLNLFLFLGFIFWVRLIIGCLALGAGAYNLKEYLTDKTGSCKVAGTERREKIMAKIQGIIQTKKIWLAIAGIVMLAFSVNLLELICSAGFPVIYTQLLSLTPLPWWQYYLYLMLYIFIFILDDLLIFGAAMLTLQLTGFSTKYKRWSNLIGGVLMLLIGILLIFKPEILMFG
jgi:thiol-disulfide isomerase/thioredoxin